MRLCVFPNDPIIAYYKKGEIKDRYYNPNNFFDEVHVISFIETDVDESKVQSIVGNAKLKIHSVGNINLKNRKKSVERIKLLVKEIKPDIIRSYNPLVEGWFASICAEELKIPFYLSLHTQYDRLRALYKKSNLKKYMVLKYTERFIEPIVLKKADKITIVYKIIEPYVIKHGGKKPELLYNRINCEQFSHGSSLENIKIPLIISVGSLIEEKNHQCIIKAMNYVDANLLIIGDGKLYDKLMNLIHEEGLDSKVTIKKSVPNNEIQNYYKSAQVFALAYDTALEGLPMPVMEAMASGLPVMIPFPKKEFSDGLEGIVLFSDRNTSSFAQNMNKVLQNHDLHKELSQRSVNKARDFDSSLIEKREAEIYSELLNK
ncbi:MAG: glycosyltransferase family 4 protein [Nitrosopumilaceae archaeon]